MSAPAVGTQVWLNDDVLFGPIAALRVTRVFKNGSLEAKSDDGRTRVKVAHADVRADEPTRAEIDAWLDAL